MNTFETDLALNENLDGIFKKLTTRHNDSVQQLGVLSVASDYARFFVRM